MVNKSPAQKVFILFLKFMKRCRAKSTLWEVDVSLSSSSELLSELDKNKFLNPSQKFVESEVFGGGKLGQLVSKYSLCFCVRTS